MAYSTTGADLNVTGKTFIDRQVVGNLVRDVLKFTVTNDGTGSTYVHRLHNIIALNICGQDDQKRNQFAIRNASVTAPGMVTIGAWPASTTGDTIISEAWGW